jgi:hypothetical protein
VKCWGGNRSGQVDNGTFQIAVGINTVDRPVDVIGLTSGVAKITADVLTSLISCALAKSCSLPLTGP